ncbi:alpha-tocopherol transfer protein-like isoform X2 [Dermacentor silvarum]|uniref:alpha-tocopherol transfer protein-like isoform X2 n=1 Tax=Dermacentor silvarum TaxID=543639 RepID=UPI00210075AE|nr:alpha-tocopherol transfer protein-like isoform X2 [Dermacentor silvarum]
MPHEKTGVAVEALTQRKCSRDIAQDDVVETPEVRQKALKRLRDLISGERHLHCPADDEVLLKFLRARKFNADRAFKVVKNYFKVRRENPEMLDDLSPSRVPFDSACRKHGLITVSRKTDPDGRAAVIVRFGAWNTDICSLNDYFRVCVVHVLHLTIREQFQVEGVVVVLDLKGLGPYHFAHYTPSNMKKVFSLVQTHFIGNDLEKLKSLVPDDVIPEELGGTNESYDYDVMEKDLLREKEFFQNLNSYGYRKQ